jgi:predicted secreted protein
MGITSALVLYAVIWWMCFLIALPFKVQTQGDLGEIVPGTHAGAPQVHNIKRKAGIVTGVAAVLWVIIAGIILSGWISLSDMDWFDRALKPL